MIEGTRRLATSAALATLLALGISGTALGYAEVRIPPAACDSVRFGIQHFHDSAAPPHMQETPAWGNTSRFVYDDCE